MIDHLNLRLIDCSELISCQCWFCKLQLYSHYRESTDCGSMSGQRHRASASRGRGQGRGRGQSQRDGQEHVRFQDEDDDDSDGHGEGQHQHEAPCQGRGRSGWPTPLGHHQPSVTPNDGGSHRGRSSRSSDNGHRGSATPSRPQSSRQSSLEAVAPPRSAMTSVSNRGLAYRPPNCPLAAVLPQPPPTAAAAAPSARGMSRQSSRLSTASAASVDDVASGVSRLKIPTGSDVTAMLKKRLVDLSLSKAAVSRNADEVNPLCQLILARLRDNGSSGRERFYPSSFRWEMKGSGSYYEKVKIDKPDEYDCMFTCDIRAEVVYADTPSPGFCALRVVNGNAMSTDMLCVSGGHDYVCPKKFRSAFRDNMKKIVKDPTLSNYEITIKRDDGRCPAVTLNVRVIETGAEFDVDIVPAVRLVEWPKTARIDVLRRIGISSVRAVDPKYLPCVVTKIHEDESSADARGCRFWRLSFTEVEKRLILHADGTQSTSNQPTCRKDVLRLLKADLVARGNTENEAIRSYDVKTVFLHIMDDRMNDRDWKMENLQECYVFALKELLRFLVSGHIRHYFVEENLMDLKQKKHLDKLPALIKYFDKLLKQSEA